MGVGRAELGRGGGPSNLRFLPGVGWGGGGGKIFYMYLLKGGGGPGGPGNLETPLAAPLISIRPKLKLIRLGFRNHWHCAFVRYSKRVTPIFQSW